jgi:surfeit locus 1 family protein
VKAVKSFFSFKGILQSLVAIALILLCLLAARWQWHKGAILANQNGIITSNISKPPLHLSGSTVIDPYREQWQKLSLSGVFDTQHQFLVKDSYYNGVYGFEVLQLFHPDKALKLPTDFWIDRGWVQAGANAETPPSIPSFNPEHVSIVARIRSENLSHQIHGSFFATGSQTNKNLTGIEHFQGVNAANYYLDLISSPSSALGPFTQEQLPDLSTGPHYAYAFQWVLFAIITFVGRFALLRIEIQPKQEPLTSL